MFRHSKSAVSMTVVCLGIAKLKCQISLGVSFLSLICPCVICSKEIYIYLQRKIKSKKIQNTFKYGCKRVYRRCGSYMMYLEDDSPHQAVTIVCELNWFSYISDRHNVKHLCTFAIFSHTTCKFFAAFDICADTMWFGHHKGYMC